MQKKRLSAGTVFWEKYKGYYYFFKVILDYKDVVRRGYASEKLEIYEDGAKYFASISPSFYLVQVFKGRYEKPVLPPNTPVLINGVDLSNRFQSKRHYKGEGWGIYETQGIKVDELNCYENIIQGDEFYNHPHKFVKGNITITFKLDFTERLSSLFFSLTELCDLTQYLMGYGEMNNIGTLYTYNDDIRRRPNLRKKIYNAIGEDPNISWCELSLKHGFDLKLLYDNSEKKEKPLSLVGSKKTKKGFPKEMLNEYCWNFNRTPLKTLRGFKRVMLEYNEYLTGNDLSPYLDTIIFKKQQLVIQHEYVGKGNKDITKQVLLSTDNTSGFTLLELTFQMQQKIGKIKNDDHVFFEGLSFLTDKDPDYQRMPIYSLVLGS